MGLGRDCSWYRWSHYPNSTTRVTADTTSENKIPSHCSWSVSSAFLPFRSAASFYSGSLAVFWRAQPKGLCITFYSRSLGRGCWSFCPVSQRICLACTYEHVPFVPWESTTSPASSLWHLKLTWTLAIYCTLLIQNMFTKLIFSFISVCIIYSPASA